MVARNSFSGAERLPVLGLYAVAGQPRAPGLDGHVVTPWLLRGMSAVLMVFAPLLGSIDVTRFCATISLCQSHWPLVRSIASRMPSLPEVTNALRVSPFTGRSMSRRS